MERCPYIETSGGYTQGHSTTTTTSSSTGNGMPTGEQNGEYAEGGVPSVKCHLDDELHAIRRLRHRKENFPNRSWDHSSQVLVVDRGPFHRVRLSARRLNTTQEAGEGEVETTFQPKKNESRRVFREEGRGIAFRIVRPSSKTEAGRGARQSDLSRGGEIGAVFTISISHKKKK